MSLPGAFVESISSITGPAGIVGPDEEVDAYVTEWRSRFVGNAALIILPGSTDEAAKVIAACNAHAVAMVPQGGNTGLCGGAIPFSSTDGPQVLLSTRRLNGVRSIDAAGFTITAEAGATVHQLKTIAAEHERLFALSLASEGSATLGGVVSTNAGGVNVLRYGTMRDQVLGLEAVLPDGQVLSQLQGLRKDNTGYRLGDLLIGAEGTLAFVTAAVCRLYALPKSTSTALLALESIDDCMAIAGQIQSDATDDVTALELISDAGLALVERHIVDTRSPFARRSPWYLLVEFSGPDDWASLEARMAIVFERLAGDPRITDACLAGSIAQRDQLWKLRHSLSEAQKLAGMSFKHDISIPPDYMAEFVEQCTRRVVECVPDCVPVIFGHLGDGNLHFNVMQAPGMTQTQFDGLLPRVEGVVHDAVVAVGGSISAEHGIGIARRDALALRGDPVRMALMRKIKRVFDPDGLMNPGKLLNP